MLSLSACTRNSTTRWMKTQPSCEKYALDRQDSRNGDVLIFGRNRRRAGGVNGPVSNLTIVTGVMTDPARPKENRSLNDRIQASPRFIHSLFHRDVGAIQLLPDSRD